MKKAESSEMIRKGHINIMFRALGYAIKQAFRQILRNNNMCTASIFSITSMLLILGLFFIIVVNINLLAETAQSQFDTIQLYIKEDVEQDEIQEMQEKLESFQGVSTVQYISEEQALIIMKNRWGHNGYLLDGLESNPFPSSFEVKVNNLEDADVVVAQVKTLKGIEDIKYYKSIVDKLLNITHFVQLTGMILIASLIIISIVIVANTVKLTVSAREREISIMKYVGATNWFIRGPFFVEGIIIGLIGSGISVAAISFAYHKIVQAFAEQAFVMFSIGLVPHDFLVKNLVWIFISLGVGIGSMGSILSMRKFLDT